MVEKGRTIGESGEEILPGSGSVLMEEQERVWSKTDNCNQGKVVTGSVG